MVRLTARASSREKDCRGTFELLEIAPVEAVLAAGKGVGGYAVGQRQLATICHHERHDVFIGIYEAVAKHLGNCSTFEHSHKCIAIAGLSQGTLEFKAQLGC